MPKRKKVAEKIIEEVPTESVKKINSKYFILGIMVLVLAVLLWRNKGLVVAATVNNQPVWRWDLEKRLVGQFGNQTIDELVSESLIKQAAAKNNITVSKTEVDNKVSDIEKTLAGKMTLQDALAQQGMTVDDFRRQVELQLMLEKLTASSVVVSDKEITDYLDKNKSTMTATNDADLKIEARKILSAGKQSAALRDYFTNLRSQAKILKYL